MARQKETEKASIQHHPDQPPLFPMTAPADQKASARTEAPLAATPRAIENGLVPAVGSVVQLRSGGPLLTVVGFMAPAEGSGEKDAMVIYYNEITGEMQKMRLPVCSLVLRAGL